MLLDNILFIDFNTTQIILYQNKKSVRCYFYGSRKYLFVQSCVNLVLVWKGLKGYLVSSNFLDIVGTSASSDVMDCKGINFI